MLGDISHTSGAAIYLATALFLAVQGPGSPVPLIVPLTPVLPSKGVSVRWSPKGATVPLTPQGDTLRGEFALGPAGAPPIAVRLVRSAGETHFNWLWVDVNRDGKLSDNERLAVTPKELRGKWWSTFDTIVDIPVASSGVTGAATRPYPLSLWYVEDPQEPTAPPTLRWSRRGWHAGQVEIAGKPAYLLITEMEMDGRFDQRDSWALSRDSTAVLKSEAAHPMDEHAWLDGQAYRPVKIDEDGTSISIVPIQPGTTEAEEIAKKDIYLPDRNVARAVKPVAFNKSLPATLAAAARQKKRVLVDFEAVWCGPCHIMDQLVFNAQAVVTASSGVLAVKVDGDDHHDLKVKYKVDGYPTVILLNSQGKEIRRAVGYQSVLDMVKLLKP